MGKKLEKYLEYISASFFLIMTLLVIYQVLMRKVFNASPSWTEELARYATIWSTLIVVPALILQKGHIMLDYFVMLAPPKIRKVLEFITGLFALVLMATFLYGGVGMIQASIGITQVSPGARIPMWIVYIVLPLSGVLMLACQCKSMIETVKAKKDTE